MLRQERQSALSYLTITEELLKEKGASFELMDQHDFMEEIVVCPVSTGNS